MKLKVKLIIFASILFFSGLFSAAPVRAGMWGESIMAEEMGQMETAIQKIINGVIMGAAKQAAVKAIEGQISNIVSGGGSGTGDAMFVTNWQEYLYLNPAKKTELVMDDVFSLTTGGKGSSSNYISASGSGDSGINTDIQNFKGYMKGSNVPSYNLNEYCSDASDPFASGNFRCFIATISNPMNFAPSRFLVWQEQYLPRLEAEQKKAEAQAIAYQGFLATTDGGSGGGLLGSSGSSSEPTVTTPGIITKEIQAYAENMSGETVVQARDIPEVITALVTKLVTKTITQGIGKAAQNAQRSDSSTGSSGNQSNNSNFGIFGNFGR